MSDPAEHQKSWRDLEIEKKTRSALELFFIYVLFVTLLRLLGHGEIAGGFIDGRVFGYVMHMGARSKPNTFLLYNFILRFRVVPLLYIAAPIAILIYVVITKANENSRCMAVCFLTFALINYLIPPVLTLFSDPIANFLSRRGMSGIYLFYEFMNASWLRFIGNWTEMAYHICVTLVMSAYIFKLRGAFINLRALRVNAGAETNGRVYLPWLAVILVTAAVFILPLFVR